ncbi:uncharacterized protein LOC129596851 isoform X2 [Paramacrobiotus metropolitanus]|uniref:uncharacterized protein LOC129596851 isoform X2 n=1 Tax=Paramacrobiotus metropolitanus TaxID=2943436 RepID=UPI0024464129|nr:uncharacterized protein LOC129596851 isoform X2 [Paramacrobiotus metropolitanus]
MGSSFSTEAGTLHTAVSEGNIPQVRHFCSKASSSAVNRKFNGETPLTLSLRDTADIGILHELLQCPRLDVNKAATPKRNTPLMTAVLLASHPGANASKLQKAELIAAHPRCRLGLRNADNWTALEIAVRTENSAIIGCLLRSDRIKQYPVEDVAKVCALAVKSENADLVGAIVDSVPEEVQKVLLAAAKEVLNNNMKPSDPSEPVQPLEEVPALHSAILREDIAGVQAILQQASAYVNHKVAGLTPLMLAACGRSPPIVQLLVDTPSIDINMTSTGFKKMPALMMCAFAGGSADEEDRVTMISAILAHPQCDPTLKDEDGVNALGMAAMFGNEKVADCLTADRRIDQYALDDVWQCVRFAISGDHDDLAISLCNAVRNNRTAVLASRLDRLKNATEALKTAMLLKSHLVNWKLLNRTINLSLRLGRPVVGSHVGIKHDEALVRMKQAEHKLNFIAELCGHFGVVEMITSNGDVEVKLYGPPIPALRIVLCHPEALTVLSRDGYVGRDAEGQVIKDKDIVRVEANLDIVRELQKNHGGLDDEHLAALGKLGEILFFDQDGGAVVSVGKDVNCFNMKALRRIDKVLCGDGSSIQSGDNVRVILTEDAFQSVQTEEFGGWSPQLTDLIGATLSLNRLHTSPSDNPQIVLEVEYNGDRIFLNPGAVGSCDSAHLVLPSNNTVTPATTVQSADRRASPQRLSPSGLDALQRNALELALLQ